MPRFAPVALVSMALSALPLSGPVADYPTLRPIDELLAGTGQGRLTAGSGADLLARATALRSRAAALRAREVIDADTRARLAALRARSEE